jgi:hypothetical protein
MNMRIGGTTKYNGSRKFPGESGPRPDKAKKKREEAQERQEYYNGLSVDQKLARLGTHGSERERKRLLLSQV